VSRSEEVTVEEKRAALTEKMTTDRLSIEDAASALGISRATAYRIMKGAGPGRWPSSSGSQMTPEPCIGESPAHQPEPSVLATLAKSKPEPQLGPHTGVKFAPQVERESRAKPPVVDELAKRYEWERRKDEAQRAENERINMETGTPLGWKTPGVREERRRRKIADALGFDPFDGAFRD
jgi:hypothetical protein